MTYDMCMYRGLEKVPDAARLPPKGIAAAPLPPICKLFSRPELILKT